MRWFKHDGNALHDAKIEKLIMKYGIEGYGLYFACVEIIAGALTSENITFELEHDSEVLAHKFKIDTLKVEKMMKYMIGLGLFQFNHETNRIICLKLASRLDISTSNNPEIKKIIKDKNYYKLLESNSRLDKISLDEIRIDEKKKKEKPVKHKYGEYKHVLLTDDEYKKLKDKFTDNISYWIKTLDEGIELKGYKYKSHYLAILKWESKNGKNKNTDDKAGNSETISDKEFAERYSKNTKFI